MKNYLKLTFLLSTFLVLSYNSKAQLNIAEIQNPHQSLNGARYLPTQLGEGFDKVEVQLMHPYLSFGNNVFSFNDIKELANTSTITPELISYALDKLKKKNIFYFGTDVNIFNIGVNVLHKDKTPFLSFGFSVRQKNEFNFQYNSELFSLIYNGNKQFAGQTISLAPSFNFLSYTDFALGAAGNIPVPKMGKFLNVNIKPAVRLRYIKGIANLNMPENAITMLTAEDGRSIDFGFNYDIHLSLPIDTGSINDVIKNTTGTASSTTGASPNINYKKIQSELFKGNGKGLGVDWGVRVDLMPNLSFNVGFTDMGFVKFAKNSITVSNHNHYIFEGYEVKYFNDQQQNITSQVDTVIAKLKPEISYGGYSVPLGSKLIFSTNFKLSKREKRNMIYYKHNFNFTYVQGFSNYLSSVKRAYMCLGYLYSIGNVCNLGVNGSLGGLTLATVGAQITFKISKVKFGINSNNILPLISLNAGRGTDIGILTAMSF
jgi:hypothetical protein